MQSEEQINYNEALEKLFLNFSFTFKFERVISFQTLSHFLVVNQIVVSKIFLICHIITDLITDNNY